MDHGDVAVGSAICSLCAVCGTDALDSLWAKQKRETLRSSDDVRARQRSPFSGLLLHLGLGG